MLVRDKVRMKHAVARAGLRVPRFQTLAAFLNDPERNGWNGPTVLKPLCGASSEDVVVFESAASAREAIAGFRSGVSRLDAGRLEAREAYEVEEFIRGPVLHFDGLIANGSLLALTASRYVGTCLGYANGKPLGSFHFPVTDSAKAWVRQALDSVGIANGSFHLEAILHNTELVFLEVGNRVGGADVVATFELATGIHLPSQELRILVKDRALALDAVRKRGNSLSHGWFVVPGHHLGSGPYKGIAGIEAFRTSPAVLRWHELAIGAALPKKITYQAHEVPLAGIVATASGEETCRWLKSLFAFVRQPQRLGARVRHATP